MERKLIKMIQDHAYEVETPWGKEIRIIIDSTEESHQDDYQMVKEIMEGMY